MKYNEGVINSFGYNSLIGEQAIFAYFRQYPNAGLDYSNNHRYNYLLIDATENYVMKRIQMQNLDSLSIKVLNHVINGFFRRPEIYMKSRLLKEEIVKQVLSPNNFRLYQNKISEINQKAKEIYSRRMSGNVTEQEKDLLANYLIKLKDHPSEEWKKIIESYAKKILEENKLVKETNSSELTLLAYYASKYVDPNGQLVDFIRVCDNPSKNNGGLYNSRFIHINKTGDFLLSIDDFLAAVCHETRHAKQDYESKTKKSLIGFQYAASDILRKNLTTANYDPYNSYHNYRYSEIETDANITGYNTASTILHRLGFQERYSEMFKRYLDYQKTRQLEFANKFGSDRSFHTIEKTLIEDLSKVIKRYPMLVKEYPSMQDFYEENGIIKSFDKIMMEAIKSSPGNENYNYYRSYLKYALSKENFENVKINKMPDEIRERYFITLIKLLNEETNEINDHLNAVREISTGKRERITPTQIIVETGKSNFNRYRKLQQILYENYDDIIRLEKKGMITTSIWNSMGIQSDMHNISAIDISNDNLPSEYREELEKLIAETKTKYSNIITRKNNERIQREISNYDEETLSMKVLTPAGAYITLRQYIEENIGSHLDRHGFFIDENGKQITMSEVIKEVISNSKNETDNSKQDNNDNPSMIEYINSLSGLSEEQKQLLIDNLNETPSKHKPKHMK